MDLGEGTRPVEVLDDDGHERRVEAGVGKRQVLGEPAAEVGAGQLGARLVEHLLRGVDSADVAAVLLAQDTEVLAGAAADVEHPAPASSPASATAACTGVEVARPAKLVVPDCDRGEMLRLAHVALRQEYPVRHEVGAVPAPTGALSSGSVTRKRVDRGSSPLGWAGFGLTGASRS